MNLDPVATVRLASEFKKAGNLQKAEELLLALIHEYPDLPAVYNNLGTVFYAQQKWSEAIDEFKRAIDLQAEYFDAYYNLGLAHYKFGELDKALLTFAALIELSPGHPGAEFHSGCIYMSRGQYTQAVSHFLAMQQVMPDHAEMQLNLGTSYLHLNNLHEATSHYLKALALSPDEPQILFNLGVINMKLGRTDDAISYYLQIVKSEPDHMAAHNNLGVTYLALQDTGKALIHFKEALRANPHNVAIRHTVNLLEHKKDIKNSPSEYVTSLFDSYADYYDPHVLYTLEYKVPHAIYDLVADHSTLQTKGLDVLDLGCGTGLCGKYFREMAKTLVGVDLSGSMLEAAEQKHIYDELVKVEAVSYLQQHQAAFDLIVAGDVLVYFGEIEILMAAVSDALRPNGMFAFSAEISLEQDFLLSGSGRFAHRQDYLEKVAKRFGLTSAAYQEVPLRTQHQQDVPGHLYLMRKESR